MVFSSQTFIFIFLPIVLITYSVISKKLRNITLLLFSLLFYAWGEPVYVLLMLFSAVVDYINGLVIHKNIATNKKLAKLGLLSSIVINLSLLGFFKYSDFLIMNLNDIFNLDIALLNLPLPIGISFYTFQTMSYTIDVYRGEAKVQKNFLDLAMYVCLFPQLIAGPIVRYTTLQEEIKDRSFTLDGFNIGFRRFITGLAKKVIIANQIGELASRIFASDVQNLSATTAWLGAIFFGLQIYFDFSGYSDMAIGLGKIFGFNFLENFNYPYISKSITEFWRRWHISLGSWFRDYLYIPLGGNKVTTSKWIRNVFIVWFVTGFWHGAGWNFIIWGLYYGLLLIIEKFFLEALLLKMPKFVSHIYLLVMVAIGWVFFNSPTLSDAINYLTAMFGGNSLYLLSDLGFYIYDNAYIIIVAFFCSTPIIKRFFDKFISKHVLISDFIYLGLLVLSIVYLVENGFNPFIYYRF